MQRHERQPSRSPQHSGQTVIKSQKNINVSAGFHIKTENDKGDDDHHRSPDAGRIDMRDTWRRPKLNKLPEVFNQQKQKKKYGGRIKQDTLQNLEKLVQNSQYKETGKYLEPLPFKEDDKKKEATENRNPLNPVKKIMKMVFKNREELKDLQDMSVDGLRNRTGLKISQCVYLQVIKRSHNTGTIKKMLHVPTLTLVCVREQPYTLKESRNAIRDLTNIWREKLSGEDMPFITIHDVLYNYPQGALSVFMQYFKSRSLLNLLDLTVNLPESVIRQVFIEVLKALDIFYFHTNTHFGGISPSQIMFTEDNHIKLSLGLFYHIPNLDSQNVYYLKVSQKTNIFDFNNTLTKFLKNSSDKNQNLELDRSLDIFKIGLCVLQCAIGSFEVYEQSPIVFQAIKYLFTEQGQRLVEINNLCCVLHSQQNLLQINSQNDRIHRKNQEKFISYLKLIKDRFSIHFVNFLCCCLKLSHSKRSTLSQLLSTPFIHTPHDNSNKTVKISLENLLSIGRGLAPQIFESNTHKKMDNFLSHIRLVLQNCGKDVLQDLNSEHQNKIYSVGRQIGFNQQKFGTQLEKMIAQVLKSK